MVHQKRIKVNAHAQSNYMLLAAPVHEIAWAMGELAWDLLAQLMHMGLHSQLT